MTNKPNPKDCDCRLWARESGIILVSTHHPSCGHYQHGDDLRAAREIVKDLTAAMERWGAEEDGIPADAWEAYKTAKQAIGENPW